jgi:hypothetical protein
VKVLELVRAGWALQLGLTIAGKPLMGFAGSLESPGGGFFVRCYGATPEVVIDELEAGVEAHREPGVDG